MAKLYIPQVGDKLKLSANWNCKIFNEYRNSNIFEKLNIDKSNSPNSNIDVTFPKGTVLKVSRLYVKSPASSYDSITFIVDSSPMKSLVKGRFWVKLMSANHIEFEEITEGLHNFTKIKNALTFVGVKNDFENISNLESGQLNTLYKELFDYFKEKNDNELVIKFDVTAEQLDNLTFMTFEHMSSIYNKLGLSLDRKDFNSKKLEEFKLLCDKTQATLHLLPVLDGYIYYYELNKHAVEFSKKFELADKLFSQYSYHCLYMESALASGNFQHIELKNKFPRLLSEADFSSVSMTHNNETVNFKNESDFYKIIKKFRK